MAPVSPFKSVPSRSSNPRAALEVGQLVGWAGPVALRGTGSAVSCHRGYLLVLGRKGRATSAGSGKSEEPPLSGASTFMSLPHGSARVFPA